MLKRHLPKILATLAVLSACVGSAVVCSAIRDLRDFPKELTRPQHTDTFNQFRNE